ncbi:sensor histidine kinase [uncultured Algibacter sp.]|uniref:ATP-binding protein n=1 Tax=uncultured Algibacter sp. TaxID=298659 RepID=UPI00262847D1|nr:sensor histidine kinase [uncultured Algibacter sp.]
MKLARKINDSMVLALVNKKLGYFYYDKIIDSAYYYNSKAEKLFRILNDKFNRAVVLLDISLLQYNDKDYTGSELTAINGLSLLDDLEETLEVIKYKSYFYNNLALIFNQLEQRKESIFYHNKAIDIHTELYGDESMAVARQKSNLANVYRDSKRYDVALNYYTEILDFENLIKKNPGLYVSVLANYAHTLYLTKQYQQLPKLYLDALKICDSIDSKSRSIPINLYLAEYYNDNNKKDSAKYYAYRAKMVSQKYYKDDLLLSLLFLSKIEDDSIAVKHYDAYIKLSDSLQKKERVLRNKFARIHYETEKIEQENIQIAKERSWLLIISVVVIIASFLLYIVIAQRNKNRELQFVQKQQETNEEIYNLMLSQNEVIEEARATEKKRISQELHDGVLGRLFGTRLSLDSLNMNNSVEAVKSRSEYIDGLKTIEEDIRKVSHELNTDFVSGSGFIDIIKTLIETQALAYGLSYDLKHDDAIIWDELSNKKKIHIYRIVQESLHNIYKHANASHVDISFKLKKNVICLMLKDDGSGFDVAKAKSGIGLKNMNSRIKEIEGSIKITSELSIGTRVTIEVPIA